MTAAKWLIYKIYRSVVHVNMTMLPAWIAA